MAQGSRRRRLAGPRRRRRVHRAGLHHDGSRRQPDHGLSPGCDEPLAPERRRPGRRLHARSRGAGRARRHGQARGGVCRGGHPDAVRSGPGAADVRRRRAPRLRVEVHVDRGERLRGPAALRAHGPFAPRDREQGARAHRHPWRRGQRDPRRWTRARDTRGDARGGRGSHRLRRRLPGGPDLRADERTRLGDHRPDRLADGRDQDRAAPARSCTASRWTSSATATARRSVARCDPLAAGRARLGGRAAGRNAAASRHAGRDARSGTRRCRASRHPS